MSGYIGSKAVLLSTTAANVTGNAEITGDLTVDTNTLFVDSTNNAVGIGTSSLSSYAVQDLVIANTGNNVGITIQSDATGMGKIHFADGTTGSELYRGVVRYQHSSDTMDFWTGGVAKMTIDASGNVLVGTTDNNVTNNSGNNPGINIGTAGIKGMISAARYQGGPISLNRLGNDGTIIDLAKDGSTVGRIGTTSGIVYIEPASSGNGLAYLNTSVSPCQGGGAVSDNYLDLGTSSRRFDDIYATNATIQTSDRNEKQDIDVLSEAETRVAQACKGLLRKFRWKDAVAEKGDDARIHFGIIAQDLQAAFEAEGLDAGRYAMFTSSTWWEADEVIPAVEAQDAVYETQVDEDGNEVQVLVSEALEAQPERTVTHTYETAEEAPEGAVERTRLGVRYPELLAFIIGAM